LRKRELAGLAWAITGSGVFLEESLQVIKALRDRGFSVTVFVSRAGEEVLGMYGLTSRLESIVKGGYPNEVVYEREEGFSYPRAGRVYKGVYRLLVVSPATLNTVSKIVNGIADSLVSNLASHFIKAGLPVFVVPSDLTETISVIPLAVERELCSKCPGCVAADVCPTGALRRDPFFKVKVSLLLCTQCGLCVRACPFNAIRMNVEIKVKPNPYYLAIIRRLNDIPGVKALDHPSRVLDEIKEIEGAG
jgi:dihydromethanopterin reductase (acceptor)